MKRDFASRSVLLGAVLSTALVLSAQSVQPPPGWKMSLDGTSRIYPPTDLPTTSSFRRTVESPSNLGGKDLEQWFTDRVQEEVARQGSLERSDPVQRGAFGVLGLERVFLKSKSAGDVVYVAFPLKEHRVLFCYSASNVPESPSFHRYIHDAGKLCGQLARSIDGAPAAAK
jgi:hypothetical protein